MDHYSRWIVPLEITINYKSDDSEFLQLQ
jgi:hypothetical protein